MNISVEPGARSPLHNESQKEDMVMFIRQKRENEKKEHLKEILNKKYLFVVVLILLCCIGAGGNEVWIFEAAGSGKTEIILKYVRPWEKNVPPAKTVTFKVNIKR